ncbi:ABC transporter permease subunit [Escherichia coli]|nr:ABC transporter permease subunit [Escherichia coli]EGJ4612064.1 ABC transporter permease subunit [Escherichia coli]EGJ4980363.1 ABC transporter permease subunit [Escherichia coli]EGJ6396975.1 ABC transporter permease subunit [Escherichia coli]EGJ6429278.1 ABC transporter permease subunit [Escherichia coli]
MKQKITDYLDEIYGGTFTATHLQKLVTRLDSAKRLITQRRKKHWDESDVVLITYADQFHSNDLKPLPTFNQFYHQWLQSIFSHVHLLPFYPWSSDDGFSVIDYHQVASEAGEWQDIQQLGECSHLMFDFVCNHMSAKSEWFKNYLQQHPGFEDFFIAVDPQTDLSAVTRPRALPLLTPFQMRDHSTRHLWTTFSDDQIDLNYRSPEVLLAMVDVLLCYLAKGAEYVRLDAVGFMWKEPGTSCIHLEKTHLIIKLLRSIIDNVAPGTVILSYVTPSISLVFAWKYMFNNGYGIVNYLGVDLLHLYEQAPLWFDNPGSSFVLVVLFAIWRYFPYAFISFLAILQTIDKSLYEAAEMDGANAWQRFRIVTLPAIMPVLATVVTLRTIWMFYMFADVYLLTTKVDILGVYLYKTAFAFNDLGKAAAISVVLFIIIFAVILLTRKRVNLNGNK